MRSYFLVLHETTEVILYSKIGEVFWRTVAFYGFIYHVIDYQRGVYGFKSLLKATMYPLAVSREKICHAIKIYVCLRCPFFVEAKIQWPSAMLCHHKIGTDRPN